MKIRKKPWMTVLRDSGFELSQNVLEDSSMPWAGLKRKKTKQSETWRIKKVQQIKTNRLGEEGF